MSLFTKSAGLARLARQGVVSNAMVKRNIVLVTPPRVRISFAEKVVHGLALVVGVTAVPTWILLHLEDYRNGNQ